MVRKYYRAHNASECILIDFGIFILTDASFAAFMTVSNKKNFLI